MSHTIFSGIVGPNHKVVITTGTTILGTLLSSVNAEKLKIDDTN